MDEESRCLATDTDSDSTTCDFDLADEEVKMVLDSCKGNGTTSTLADDGRQHDRHSNPIHSTSLLSRSQDDNSLHQNLASHDQDLGLHDIKMAACNFEKVSCDDEVGSHDIDGVFDGGGNRSEILAHKSTSYETRFEPGFEEQAFHRPRFSHSPINMRRPLVLSSPQTTPSVQIPAIMNQYLRTYQQEGVQFLYRCFRSHSGAVLCDDMGLGKTVQVIAFMSAILYKKGTKADVLLTGPKQTSCSGTFLIMCPSSVVYNWTSELEAWSHIKYCVFHGGRTDEALDRARRKRVEVVLTTHETARTHLDELNLVEWLTVILDEVQVIKNPKAQVTMAMNSLKEKRRIGLTGTALQNNLDELWCILNWANPGCLGTLRDFNSEFEHPILNGQKNDSTKRQVAIAKQRLSELELLMKRWVLRRTKQLIATQMPKKEEVVVFCPISELQEQIYQEILETEDAKLVLQSGDPCECFSGKKRGSCCYKENCEGISWQKLGYSYTTLLSKCANHLGLLLPSNTTSDHQRDKVANVCEEVFSKHPQFLSLSRQASFLTLSDVQYCGKMQVIQNLLSRFCADRSKVIIFSNSVILLNMVENYVVSQGYTYSRLHGNTKTEDKARVVSKFNTDPAHLILLVSPKCGEVGLNVSGANRVIVFDPSWNPATDLQAQDRTFRIGQSRDVKVFRLVTEGTVEEMIYVRQVYKQQLANMALEGSKEGRCLMGIAGAQEQKGELFGYNNLWPLRKQHLPGLNLTMSLLKCLAYAQLWRSECRRRRDGTTTIGDKSVAECSVVEDHIGQEALSDPYRSQQHSQKHANLVTHKLAQDISDESDDIDSYASEKDVTFPESSSPSCSRATTKTTPTARRVKSQGEKIMKVAMELEEKGESQNGDVKKHRKNTFGRGRLKDITHTVQSHSVKKRRPRLVRKGVQFVDGSPPLVATATAKCHNFYELNRLASDADGGSKEVGLLPHLECSKEISSESTLSYAHQASESGIFKSYSQSSYLSQAMGSIHTLTLSMPASEYSCTKHETLDDLFEGPSSCEAQPTNSEGRTIGDAAASSVDTFVETNYGRDRSGNGMGTGSVLSSVRFSDVGLCTPLASTVKSMQEKQQSSSCGDGTGSSGNSSDKERLDEDQVQQHSGDRISQVLEEGFNIDELFGF